MSLSSWGWNDEWAARFAEVFTDRGEPGRITGQERDRWSVEISAGSSLARIPSRARIEAAPVVGDWAVVEAGPSPSDPWSILDILPRRSKFSRGTAGTGAAEQVLAANVDRVWIVHGLDQPLNPRRLERYLAVAWESGAVPAVVLTKSDLALELAKVVAETRAIAMGVDVFAVSMDAAETVGHIVETLEPGETIGLLGPSGAGKSTLVNLLAQRPVARTGTVRPSDHKGRHTTTRRELFLIAGGAMVLDTPGLRELRVWDLTEGLEQAFPEIEELAQDCRFADCRHQAEPGCAILRAVESGHVDPARLASYRKLQAEAAFQARKSDPQARASFVAKHKTALKTLRFHQKLKEQRGDG